MSSKKLYVSLSEEMKQRSYSVMSYSEACIIGGGSIGGLMAYYLYRGGIRDIIVYYGSRESVRAVGDSGGLNVIYNGYRYLVPVTPRYYKEPYGKCRYVLNCVKAYNVTSTLDLMKNITDNDSVIVMFQNGFGSLELAEEELGFYRVAGAVVYIGAWRKDRNTIIHAGGNTIFIGFRRGDNTRLFELSEWIKRGGCDIRITDRIDFYRWLKLGLNAVVNPLTAIARAPNKIVLSKPGKIIAEQIIDELIEAALKDYISLDKEKLLKIIYRGVRNTAENYSSMLQDILSGKKTEIDYINGFIARKLGRANSVNNILTQLIHLIEETYK